MTQADMREFMERTFKVDIMETRAAGQKEYAQETDNCFANFQRIGAEQGLDQKTILWTYLLKHKDGVSAYLKGHTSQREHVSGRIKDMIVYLFLLWAMISEEKLCALNSPSEEARI